MGLVVEMVVPEPVPVVVDVVGVGGIPDREIGPPLPRKVCDQSTPTELCGLRWVSTNLTAMRISFEGWSTAFR